MVIETTSEWYLTLEILASVPVLDHLENDRSGQNRELKNVVVHVFPSTTEVHI
jgi:hypothetical protein